MTRRLFFYGTLCHLPLLETVLGQGVPCTPATLPDHIVHWVADQPFPMISVQSGSVAQGVVVTVTDAQVARLDYYEGSFHYDLRTVEVLQNDELHEAEVYFPDSTIGPQGKPWSLQDWVQDYGALTVEAALEEMSYFGTDKAEHLKTMQPMIRSRAQSRLNGRTGRKGVASETRKVNISSSKRAYVDFFALDEYHMQFEKFDGSLSDTVKRGVFIAADAVIVLPYDPVRDRVLLVEQVRMGPIARQDPNPWMLEPIAGRIDGGETPHQAAHREAAEEAGLTLRSLEPIGDVYPTPGCSAEFFYIYCAICDLPDDAQGVGGLDSEAEDIKSHVMSFDALMELLDTNRLVNGQVVLCALWLARHRDRLMNSA